MKRRSFLSGTLALAGLPACANAPDRSARPVAKPADAAIRATPTAQSMIRGAGLGGNISAVVADARTGEVLEAVNPIRPLPPASTLKAVTALYALETLGADHRFTTRLIAAGPIRNGRLDGDLVLVGGGDPSLDTDGLHALAVAAKEAGLREVSGRFVVHAGPFGTIDRIDGGQPDHVGYNPAVSGLNLNFNRVHFSWKRGGSAYETALAARTARFRPAVTTSRMAVEDRALPVFTYARRGDVDAWTVARRQLGRTGSRWLPVRNPMLYAGDVMQTMLRANGIVVPAPVRGSTLPDGTVLATEAGAALDRVARGMLRYSTNLTAEVLGLSSSVQRGLARPDLTRSGAMMSDWLASRTGVRRPDFDDHSGLNGTSRMTGLDMVRALTADGAGDRLRPILKDMTVEGRRKVRIRAKTGTLNFVSGLAGYFDAGSGRPLAFAVIAADTARRAGLSRAERERPRGGKAWGNRARRLQYDLISRWSVVHG